MTASAGAGVPTRMSSLVRQPELAELLSSLTRSRIYLHATADVQELGKATAAGHLKRDDRDKQAPPRVFHGLPAAPLGGPPFAASRESLSR